MHVFDEIRVQNLDRRQFQLTVLASMSIAVLATGVAILMYPAIFSQSLLVSGQSSRFAFYGFCLLSVLLVGYLWDRQITIRHLTQQVQMDQRRSSTFRLEACKNLLNTIPGVGRFREQLSAHTPRGRRRQHGGLPSRSPSCGFIYPGWCRTGVKSRLSLATRLQVIHRRLRGGIRSMLSRLEFTG